MEIEFNTDQAALEEQIQAATKLKFGSSTHVPVVTVCKLSPDAVNSFYGFHFEPKDKVKVGDVQHLEDRSVRRVEFIVE